MARGDDRETQVPDDPAPATDETLGTAKGRRKFLGAAVGITLAGPALAAADKSAKPPNEQRPKPGDVLVFRFGDRAGQPIGIDDVPIAGDLVNGVTKDPQSGVVRDGSRLNGLIVVRFAPEDYTDETRVHTAEGVIAYSSVCTHEGCDLSQLLPDELVFKCYCHYSKFDPRDAGQPRTGPARRRLAVLPLKYIDNQFIATDGFVGKVGFKKKR